jgi:hypothetical protein
MAAAADLRGPESRWLRSYVAAARGDFVRAERDLRAMFSATSGRDVPVAVTLGSVLRQTGRHGEARTVERAALASAPGGAARVHLLIGLAADAVGLGELPQVDTVLRRLRPPVAGGWRAAVRLRWVRCERDLLAGRPAAAAVHARRALAIADRARARRHVAKSKLFLGVALLEAAGRDRSPARSAARANEARRALRSARSSALTLGARPIVDVVQRLLR